MRPSKGLRAPNVMCLHLISSLAQRWKLTTGGCCLDCIWPEKRHSVGAAVCHVVVALPRWGSVDLCWPPMIEGLNAAQAHALWMLFLLRTFLNKVFSIKMSCWCDYYSPYHRLIKVTCRKSSCRRRESAIFSFPPGMLLRSATAAWLPFPRATVLAAFHWLHQCLN